MKRSAIKLIFRHETLRFLSGVELRNVEGASQGTVEHGCAKLLADSANPANGCVQSE
jgi:hypothetical protein